ncbi:unnamed protein product [Sphagnum balticum]
MCRTSGMVFEMNPVLTIQCAGLEHCDDVSFTDLERAKAAVPESHQPLSDIEVVLLNKNIVQDEFEETSNAPSSTDKHEERSRLSGISEVISSATTKSKEIVVDPDAALCDCVVQIEFQNNPTTIEDDESSKGRGLVEMVDCVFATANCKMDADETTDTPLKGFGVFLWKVMHDSTLTILAFFVEEVFGKLMTKACCTDHPMDPRMGQIDASSLWIGGGCRIYFIQDANGR